MSEQDRNENTEIETVETTATESKDSKEHKEDEYEKDLLYLPQTGKCCRKDDRSSQQYLRVRRLYAEEL